MTDEKKPDDKKADKPEKGEKKAARPEGASGGEAKADKPEKSEKKAARPEGAAGGEAKADKPEKAEKKAARPEGAAGGEAKADKPEKAEKKAGRPEGAAGGEAKADRPEKAEKKDKGEKKEAAPAAGGEASQTKAKGEKADKGGKDKGGKEKGKKGKKEEGRRAGYPPNIDESLKVQPARLRLRYRVEMVPALMKELNLKNPNEVPRLTKITLNMGLGEALANNKLMESAVDQLAVIAGQKPVVTKSRKAIANFKLRENQSIGCMVTLRGERMYEFLDRLINVALPRVRDFKGISAKAFDGRGNYTLGIREQLIFPEINYDQIEKVKGLNVCIVTTAKNDEQGLALLKAFGAPFRV